ncbi:alpha/beta fold hydrolase [Aeromicrobium chenweiae]|uniref:alpha/beta fold hydrolase n=1 Tax=Aeromicrobium chenweiae TaxID=2079793 RepID=UPI0019007742|nr:alpha/beta hydrolase [Aeromicrobium chenweiae]
MRERPDGEPPGRAPLRVAPRRPRGWRSARRSATDFRPDQEKFTLPTLVIHGDADQVVPFQVSGRRSAESIPGSELVVIEGGPHGINVSHAEQFNAALLTFLAR